MSDLYRDGSYEINNPTWHEEDAGWKAKQIAGLMNAHGLTSGEICEIGCGTGEILLRLEELFPEIRSTGYEISPQAYERLRTKETERTKFVMRDAASGVERRVDVAMMIDVIEHIDDYVGFLKAMKGIATHKIFHIPLDLSVQSIARSWPIMNLRRSVGHVNYFFKDTALASLSDAGYEIVEWRYTASRLELPNQALTSRMMRLPRRILFRLNRDLTVRVLGGYSLLVLAR